MQQLDSILYYTLAFIKILLQYKNENSFKILYIFESIIILFASFFVRSRGKKHSVILRTQLTVRVHACIGECCVTCLYMCLT